MAVSAVRETTGPLTVAHRLIAAHLVGGRMAVGEEIALRVDQTLAQDATGTLVMQELEALGLDRVRTEPSVQYVDHNLLQTDERNAEDHTFLRSAARHFGLWYSKPGNGVSHPTHMQRFGVPGRTLIGSDSHTCAAGALGMLAIGTGGLDVALAMAGEPLHLRMPTIWGIRLEGELPDWVSAKDVILELLRRHGVTGGVGRILEYHGPGLAGLTAMDRHVIANMGAELGATASVFPADDAVRAFLRAEGREDDYLPLAADPGCRYDLTEDIDLAALEPLVAKPSSPGNVVPVREVAGTPVGQVVIGSSANPGLRDFAVAAAMVKGRQTSPEVSFDINPTSREILQDLTRMGATFDLIAAGARIHQAGCLGCIGMGQAPAVGQNSLRTFPRNFPGRSGTADDAVWLCSPETAAASALAGRLTDPRVWASRAGVEAPHPDLPEHAAVNTAALEPPLPPEESASVRLVRGPNISALPELDALPRDVDGPVLLKVGDDVSTDEISPAGAKALPYRSNLPRLADFTLTRIARDYPERARRSGPHLIVAGENYGQGSSREHAAITPRLLGLRAVIAKSFARIHWQNLANFGVLALEFADPADYDRIDQGDRLRVGDVRAALADDAEPFLTVHNATKGEDYRVAHRLSKRQRDAVLAGGVIPALAAARA
ncbi:aconitate hydratase [Yinghuangia sp. ASG 101]|uniref:aconitate hydratase n=1 Tax=Yinghuangia sp. ASG 101 TaxID=2896848 RepID=UPI001E40F6AB|nr:aconitate hydratase [Yinghuangia sp. ASG 101]UGQ11430.1 aconitate hydratase [Yinghuangia sp. ASG 101]